MSRKKVGVLISGRGSNMSALIEAAKAPDYPAEIVGVLSNRASAVGLQVAAAEGIATASLAQSKFLSRDMFEDTVTQVLESWEVDIVCLAGFMRILGEDFVNRWAGRMINIHPSLLPLYKGLDTHARAIADGATEHGCTVHYVTPGLDEGEAILQAKVPVLAGDTPETLSTRVLVEEHRIYPEALKILANRLP
ncbi:phosphoribosylglycinamide formyltransferase [Devosia sp. SD17-2]|uniref:phosphoribosylglycinamide formyltransferase n=1 Tax=Devosia sp. SD17-2 TaxID=2976459 RepID=UPI0023D8C827|nr:phosphoribosylglycinamide formyltransferase [Devosia sp. SD17-2]WEJ31583.1 phosphoribosylglycinamide formyltransferase [Devosia sp. SD17-2]